MTTGWNVLLVDDDAMMIALLEPYLKELGTRRPVVAVRTARTPQAALAALDELVDPVAVLSDFNLKAALNGIDVLQEAAKRRPGSVRILFSGYSLDQIGDLPEGVHGFVEKPLHVAQMLAPIVETLDAHG